MPNSKKSKSRDKNRPSCSSGSGKNSVSGQTTISGSGQASGSGPIAKKNKFRDKNRPSGSSGSGQTLVSGQTAISSYGQVSGSCQASGSGQTTKKNKKITLKEKNKKTKWFGPTTCAICKKKFTRHSDMQTHVASIHEGKKPYQCPRCGMKFGQNSAAHQHFRNMHSEELETVVSLQVKINYFFKPSEKKKLRCLNSI